MAYLLPYMELWYLQEYKGTLFVMTGMKEYDHKVQNFENNNIDRPGYLV